MFSQIKNRNQRGNNQGNTAEESKPKEKPPINLYKIISSKRDTTFVDTTLSIQKDYKFNYLRKDDFELIPFNNVGQAYNTLAYSFREKQLLPKFVAQGHHFNFMGHDDISYYHVPTPLSDLYFKTAFEQGQQLDAFLTVNTSEKFNFSIAYKGVRSLGKFQHELASTGNFRFTTNYHTESKRYQIRSYILAQDIINEENGGLQENAIQLFIEDDPEFKDRGRLDVRFENAKNVLKGFRAFAEHEYQLISDKDSLSTHSLLIGNNISYDDKSYLYVQDSPFSDFGESYTPAIHSRVNYEEFKAEAFAKYSNKVLGNFSAFANYTDHNYGYNSVLILDEERITNRIKGTTIQAGATFDKEYKGFKLFGEGAINVSSDFDGNYINAGASYAFNEDTNVKAEMNIHSVAPNYNFLLYQNDYKNYNWQNNFDNVKTQELHVKLKSEKFFNADISYTGIDDYTYFGIKPNDSTTTPLQYSERVDYLKVKVEKEVRYKKFALANTIMYQSVLSGEYILNVPEIITRNTLYYQDHWFKKAMFMQAGVTLKYFTQFNSNAYDPVLAEFYVQNDQELGGFPMVDIFFNAKVRQTRIYFKFENINAMFSSTNEYFSAPGYPYRDPVIRFGLVWNFFL